MSTTFVAIAGVEAAAATRRLDAALRWSPQRGELALRWSAPCGLIHLAAVASMPELLRGMPWCANEAGATVVDGWAVLGRGASATLASAPSLADALDPHASDAPGAWAVDALADVDGHFALADVRGGGLLATTGFLGLQQLYAAELPGGLVVANRPLLCAAAASDDGVLPATDGDALAWLLSASRVPFGDGTVWPGVRLLGVDEIVTWRPARGVVRYLRSRRGAGERAVAGTGAVEPDWRALADDLVGRVRALGAVEGVGFRLALTGGKDSRLVLAALCAAGLVDRVDHAYLKAAEGHADVAVGRAIAARAGVAFRRYDAPVAGFGAEVLARHIALTGGMLGAWDLKAHQAVPRHVGLHGGYGEIYKSHALHFAHLARLGALGAMGADAVGWKLAARHYQHPRWIDPFGLMHARPAAKLAAVYADWLDARRAAGQPLADLHDAWHRGCRMRRWLGQSLQAGAALAPMVNPLGSYALLDAYLALPLRDRIDHRMHFELFEAIDPALGRAPFAGDRWARRLLRDAARTKSVESSSQSSSLSGQGSRPAPPAPQRAFAARHHGVIAAALADRADDGFYDVFKRAAVAGMVARAAGGRASHREIEAVLALWTARAVLRGGFEPVQVVFDAAAE